MAKPTDSATQLVAMFAEDPQLQRQIKEDPVATLQTLARPLQSDKWVYLLVVTALGLVSIFVVTGVFILKAIDNQTTIPDALVAIASASVAALAALLAPSLGAR
jgi:hypothetical protein